MTDQYLLTAQDLCQLTGFKRPGKQRDRLKELNIAYIEDHRGYPVVRASDVQSYFERRSLAQAS